MLQRGSESDKQYWGFLCEGELNASVVLHTDPASEKGGSHEKYTKALHNPVAPRTIDPLPGQLYINISRIAVSSLPQVYRQVEGPGYQKRHKDRSLGQ